MPSRRGSGEGRARLYMHDVFVPGIRTTVSTACTGATCTVCAGDPAAAERAGNPYFPWTKEAEDLAAAAAEADTILPAPDERFPALSDTVTLRRTDYDEMVAALRAAHGAVDTLFARCIAYDKKFFPSKTPEWEEMMKVYNALQKVGGVRPPGDVKNTPATD